MKRTIEKETWNIRILLKAGAFYLKETTKCTTKGL